MANVENNYAAGNAIQVNAPIAGNDLTIHHSNAKGDNEKAQECRDALFLTDQRVVRDSLIDTKGEIVAGTCEWITENELYCEWLNCTKQFLWISGGPGKGKTMLSIFLTKELEKTIEHRKDATLLYFFCSHQDERLNSAVAILRGLLYQIISKHPQLIKHVLPHFNGPNTIDRIVSSYAALWIIFERCLKDTVTGTIFCVLDGLDECEGISSLLAKFVNLSSPRDPSTIVERFRLVVSSREISGLAEFTRLKLDPDSQEQVTSDIRLFISAQIGKIAKLEGFNEDIRAHVQRTLLERAEGTFLWVGFLMNELCQKKTCLDVLETLHDFPKGLDPVYRRMLLQVESNHREITSTILRWVALAFRPLTLKELAAAISLKSHIFVNKSQVIRDQITRCGAFLKVRDDEVSLVHQSAKNYLLREHPNDDIELKHFSINLETANLELAQRCFAYIQNSLIADKPLKSGDAEFRDFPLLRYAVIHWADHLRYSGKYAKNFDQSDTFFNRKSKLCMNWWRTYHEAANSEYFHHNSLSPLHIAAYFGIFPLVQKLLKKPSLMKLLSNSANEKDSDGWTALMWAALGGHEVVMKLLVDHGANVNVTNSTKEYTALYLATLTRKKAASKLLLESGANPNTIGSSGSWTALHLASVDGDMEEVQLLLDHGANTNIIHRLNGWTALHCAVAYGNKTVVQLLIDHGANINATDRASGPAPLHLAATFGDAATIQLLLDYGVNVNLKHSKAGVTALYDAVSEDNEALVHVLIDHGADVNIKCFKNEFTALYFAISQRNETLIQALIDHGADINVKCSKNEFTALHLAVNQGNEALVQVLIDHGADVNIKCSKDEFTALHLAAIQGYTEIVRLLVENSADVDIKCSKNEFTALHLAVNQGNEALVQVLIDHGADVNIKCSKDEFTALHLAAIRGYTEIVRLLGENNADVDIKVYKNGFTALRLAISQKHQGTALLLLNHGADIDMEDRARLTALQLAIEGEHMGKMQLQVEHGACFDAKRKFNGGAA